MRDNYRVLLLTFLSLISFACARKAQVTASPSYEIELSIESLTISDLYLNAAKYEGEEITLTGIYRDFSRELIQGNFSQQKGKYNFMVEQEGRYLWIRSSLKPTVKAGETVTVTVSIEKDKEGRYYFKEVVSGQ